MPRVARFVVILLLAMTLPLQAVTATTMALCGTVHAGVETHADPTPSAHAGHHGTHPTGAKQLKSKSAACEACGSAAGLPPSPLSLAGADLGDGFARIVSIGAAAFLTAAPKRPPRPFLA